MNDELKARVDAMLADQNLRRFETFTVNEIEGVHSLITDLVAEIEIMDKPIYTCCVYGCSDDLIEVETRPNTLCKEFTAYKPTVVVIDGTEIRFNYRRFWEAEVLTTAYGHTVVMVPPCVIITSAEPFESASIKP